MKTIANVSCVYAIINKLTMQYYIGSTAMFYTRKDRHFNALKKNKHHSKYLQRSYNKYIAIDPQCFEMTIIEQCPEDQLVVREQYFIDLYNPEYNMNRTAGSRPLGYKHSDETKAKVSVAMKGRKHSEEWKAKLRGRKASEEAKAKMSATRRGRKHSAETIAKMKGLKRSEETKNRMSVAFKGRKYSEETKLKMSLARKKYWANKKQIGET